MDQKGLRQPITQPRSTVQQPTVQPPIFNIPKIQTPEPPAGQPIQSQKPSAEPGPEKKKIWKTWLIVILVLLIVAGLGYYFLKS